MYMRLTFFLFLLLPVLTSWAQEKPCAGKVLDLATGEAVAGVTIMSIDSSLYVVTDERGRFSFNAQKAGSFRLSRVGYTSELKRIVQGENTLYLNSTAASLNEVVVTGTLKTVLKSSSPVAVEVYTPQFFKRNPSPAIFESLQQVNGVRPQLNCNVCNTGDIHINGMEGPYTLILIDGMPIVSSLSSVYGLSGIPMSLVERIEVVKGPAASLYGPEAIGGLINIITKNPLKAPVISADISSTSWKEYNADLAFKFQLGNKVVSLAGISFFNYSNPVDNNKDGFTDVTLQKRASVFNKYTFQRNSQRAASFAWRYLYEDRWGGETNWNKSFSGSDSIYGETITTNRVELIGSYQLPIKGKWFLNGSYNNHEQKSYYGKLPFMARQQVAFTQLTWDTKKEKQDILAGAVLRYNWYDDNTAATTDINTHKTRPDKITIPGLFFQDEFQLSPTQTLLAGIRSDYHPIHKFIITPRLAWKYSFPDKSIIRLNAGTGFRTVNIFTEDHAALTGARDVVIKGTLAPERSYNINLNAVTTITKPSFWLTLDGSLWYTYFTNRIVPDYSTNPNQIIYDNLDGYAFSRGASITTSWAATNGFRGHWGFTLQDVKVANKINSICSISRPLLTESWSSNWSLSYRFNAAGITLDYTGNIYGSMKLPLVSSLDPRPAVSPVWSVHSFQVTKNWGRKWELYVGIKNLFNWTPAARIPFLIARSEDPFDKKVTYDANGQILATQDNPYALSFDPNYVYAPNQGRRLFIGLRLSINH